MQLLFDRPKVQLLSFRNDLLIQFDCSGCLQPPPGRDSVVAQRSQEADHQRFGNRKIRVPIESTMLPIPINPSGKPDGFGLAK